MTVKGDKIKEFMYKELEEQGLEPTDENCLGLLMGIKDAWKDETADGPDEQFEMLMYVMSLEALIFGYRMKLIYNRK